MSVAKLKVVLLALVPFVLAACIPEGLRVPESPLLRQLERKSGLIAYVGTDFNIYTVDQGGGNLVALTADGRAPASGTETLIYQFPSWSPVDNRLAYVRIKGPRGAIDEITLYTASPDGRDIREISSHPDELSYYLYWSPNGENIAFLATTENGSNQILKLVPSSGGETQIVDTGNPYFWDWSPDSSQLLIHEGPPPGGRLSFLFPGDEVREEGVEQEPGRFHTPAWSPDGQNLLLAIQNRSGKDELILADQFGRKIRSLAFYDGSIAFAWSPDGRKLAYLTDENLSTLGTLGPLTIIDMDNLDNPIQVSEDLVYAFFWSPDSQKLAYFEPGIPTDETGQAPENPTVFFQLFVREMESTDSELVTTFLPTDPFARMILVFDQYHRSDTIWSPDSRSLVLSVISNTGDPTIWVVPASGGITPRYIADGMLAFWSWK